MSGRARRQWACFLRQSKNCRYRTSFLDAEAGKFIDLAFRMNSGEGGALNTNAGGAWYRTGGAAPVHPIVTRGSSVTPASMSRFISSFVRRPMAVVISLTALAAVSSFVVNDQLMVATWSSQSRSHWPPSSPQCPTMARRRFDPCGSRRTEGRSVQCALP